jgi:cation transport regulator ChaB
MKTEHEQVREALFECAQDAYKRRDHVDDDGEEQHAFGLIAQSITPEGAAKLVRLLKL